MKKRKLKVFLSMLLILVLGCQSAYAAPAGSFRALGNTETGILYGYENPQDIKIVLDNTLSEDVKIVKVETTNPDDFSADLETDITVAAGERADYPVHLKTGKTSGTYEAEFTFTDENSNTYTAKVKAIVNEEVVTSSENIEDVVWDYENPLTAKVKIKNCTKDAVTFVKAESSNAVFEIKDLAEENLTIESLKEGYLDVTLPTGMNAGLYKTTITLTDQDSSKYTQEVTIEVVKRELTVPAITGEYAYNSKKQEIVFDANFIEKYIGLSEDYGSAVKAGHYAPVVYLKDKANTVWVIDGAFTTTNQTLSWDIEKYQIVKPAAKDKEYVYNGNSQLFEFENFTDKLFEKEVLKLSGGERKDAGTTTVTVSIIDKENFTWDDKTDTDLTFSWAMDRMKVNEPVAVKTSFDYNGQVQAIEFEEGSIDENLMTVSNNARTETGTQEVTVSLKDKVNYKWASSENDADLTFTLSIGVPVYTAPTISGSYTYNGKVQQPVLSGFDADKMSIKNNSGKDASTYSVVVSLKDKAHAVWADTNTNEDKVLTWTIGKAPVTVKANNITAKVGDTLPVLNADSYKITGINLPDRLGFIPDISYESIPDMTVEGETNIIVSGPAESADKNYSVTYENGKLTVSNNPAQAEKILSVILNFDLPIAGSKDMLDAIDNVTLNTSFVEVSFEAGSGGAIGVFEKGTDLDITQDVLANGLPEAKDVYLKVKITPDDQKVIDPEVTKVIINGTALPKEDITLLAGGEYVKAAFKVPAYRVHFTKGAGTGSMMTQYAYSTSDYTMPASGFTAPSGMEFSSWKLEGEDVYYTAGEKVRLEGSINLIAQYQEKKEESSGGSSGGIIIPGGSTGSSGGSSIVKSPREITKIDDVQKPVFVVPTGVTYNVSKDGTAAVFTAKNGKTIKKIIVNGISKGAVRSITGLKTGDKVVVEIK